MGEEIGAEVWLDQRPLKYDGLSYTEIWITEAQERMVLAVPPEQVGRVRSALRAAKDVEATVIGRFVPTGRLQLKYRRAAGRPTSSMHFLHDGRPPVVREARVRRRRAATAAVPTGTAMRSRPRRCCKILGSLNVASKEWIIRQYDHEVQGGSVIKPLVGVRERRPERRGGRAAGARLAARARRSPAA